MKNNFSFSIINYQLLIFAALLTAAETAAAQSGGIGGVTALRTPDGKPVPISQVSLTYQAPVRQKVYDVEDIVRVHVKSNWTYNNTANNQRKKKIETSAEITYWSKITGIFNLPVRSQDTASLPALGGKIDHKTQNQGKLDRTEKLDFEIACRVSSVMDNGNLFIEGTQSTQIGEEGKVIYVGGIIRPDDIKPNHTIESAQVSALEIKEVPSGNVYDTARRPWGTRLIEQLKPF
ncbi:MAG: flagellar basal body L-ring protein FlgH [Planctomycetaceae bacterium]|jgi:flagellar L-ring protein precursor FlgH|nr:flagellar basal body L-ring protein FlgH [Planctomycetaceae bacterium]